MTRSVLALAAVAALAACGPSKESNTALSSSESWCPDNFEVGPSDTCFAIPDKHDATTPVLVYLHGVFAGHGSPEEWALVHGAVARGFAVVIPRGKRGVCAWKAELKDSFCWPTETDDPASFKHVVAEWDRVLWQVDTLLEGGTHKRYVIGSGNGASFASFLATQGLFTASGYALVDGAPLAAPSKGKPTPMLFLVASGNTDEAPKMRAMHDTFAKAGWTHAYCTRPGVPGLGADDVDGALRFFKREADGSLKPEKSGGYACEGALKPAP
jgi:poly(3-hydroxybutyrate) depolymerase